MRRLAVLLYGEHVAWLEQATTGRRALRYLPDVAPATPLSLALPFRTTPFTQAATDPFIEGLLPEREGVREAIARQFGVSPRNPFALLEHVGLECAGAAQFAAEHEIEAVLRGVGALEPIDDAAIGERLRELRSRPDDSWMADRERWSLAGAQAKFALRWEDGWHTATGAEPTTHIVKPGVDGFRHQALNEHLCLATARTIGLRAARSEYAEFDGEPAIVVERYDRPRVEGSVVRLHQEDLCQATSTPPRRKYESDGGPSARTIVATLRSGGAPEDSVHRFLEGLVFNHLIGAPDAHAKNYSILLAPGVVELAPLYDVASALPYDRRKGDGLGAAAMAVGGVREFGRVEERHWVALAGECRIEPEWLLGTVRRLAASTPDALADAVAIGRGITGVGELAPRLLERVAHLCATTTALVGGRA